MSHPGHPSSARLRVLTLLLSLFAATLVHAQTVINYDALPSCARNCVALKTAQDGCVPPAAQVTNQQTYVSCFCQSDFLKEFYSGSSSACSSACTSPADSTAVQEWYVNFCRTGQDGVTSSATSGSPTATGTTSASTSSGTASTHSVINDPDGDGDASNNYSGSWISAHWKWVVMLAVIFLAMIFFSLLGLWLRKRHRAKHDAMRANLAAPGASIGALPPPPPMTHLKNNDSGTLASTIDLSTTTAGTPSRSRSHTLTRFPNGSMNNVAPPPPPPHVVWGPHQHQAATRGYEYHPHMGGSPGPSVPSTPVSIPTPSMTPVTGGGYNRYSSGTANSNGKTRSSEVISEVADEDRIEAMGGGREGRLRRKLSRGKR